MKTKLLLFLFIAFGLASAVYQAGSDSGGHVVNLTAATENVNYTENIFNDSIAVRNLTFLTSQNISLFVDIPKNSVITSAFATLRGLPNVTWISNSTISNGLPTGSQSFPNFEGIIDFSGTQIVLTTNATPASTGIEIYSFNGTQWIKNTTLGNGLPASGHYQMTFFDNLTNTADSHIVAYDGANQNWSSWSWDGTTWLGNSSLTVGLDNSLGLRKYVDIVKNFSGSGNFELLVEVGASETFRGYTWNGAQWNINNTLSNISNNPYANGNAAHGIQLYYNFSENNKWNLFVGSSNVTESLFRVFEWNGTHWLQNGNFSERLTTGSAHMRPAIGKNPYSSDYKLILIHGADQGGVTSFQTSIYPNNPYLNIGNDTINDWNETGEFNATRSGQNINATSISDFLSTCIQDSNGLCQVPFNFSSAREGVISILNLNISYSYNISNLFTQPQSTLLWNTSNLTPSQIIVGSSYWKVFEANQTAQNVSQAINVTGFFVNETSPTVVTCQVNGTSATVNSSFVCVFAENITQGSKLNRTVKWQKVLVDELTPLAADCSDYTLTTTYCYKTTQTGDTTSYNVRSFIEVNDSSVQSFPINYSQALTRFSNFANRAAGTLNISVNSSSADISLVSSGGINYITIGTTHSGSSSLSTGKWQVDVSYSVSGGSGGGGGGGGGGVVTSSQCGNFVCEYGENNINCNEDCKNVTFKIQQDSYFQQAEPGGLLNCTVNPFGCPALRILNPTATNSSLRVAFEQINKDPSFSWATFGSKSGFTNYLDIIVPGGNEAKPGFHDIEFFVQPPVETELKDYTFNIRVSAKNDESQTRVIPVIVRVSKGGTLSSVYRFVTTPLFSSKIQALDFLTMPATIMVGIGVIGFRRKKQKS